MAKKTVASLQTGEVVSTKVIKMVRSPKTGAYMFKEEVVHNDDVKAWFAKNWIADTPQYALRMGWFPVNPAHFFVKPTSTSA